MTKTQHQSKTASAPETRIFEQRAALLLAAHQINSLPWHMEGVTSQSIIEHLVAQSLELRRACQAALAYLADPPSKFAKNRAAAIEIIREALKNSEASAQ